MLLAAGALAVGFSVSRRKGLLEESAEDRAGES